MKDLAIVIPAYKIDYFQDAIESLVHQTNKNFTVYVGDDYSTSDFESLINRYSGLLDIVYKKFDYNLGSKDLVAQWSRCIEMTKGEPWLWLFSDDDVIGKNCVELFYKEMKNPLKFDIYHFDVKIINSNGRVVYTPHSYPRIIDVKKLYKETSKDNIRSFVVENIFSRDIYNKVKGFESFPLAWGSDMATWIKMGREKGIKTITGDYVYWRRSDKNITPSKVRSIVKKKFLIQTDYYLWLNNWFNSMDIRRFNKYVFFRYCVHYSNCLTYSDIKEVADYGIKNGIITLIQKNLTLLLLPIIRIAHIVKTKILIK